MNVDFSWLIDSWRFLARALWMTLLISVLSVVLGFAIGVAVGALRTYGGRGLGAIHAF
jgi:ABC-type amino acid transport system permease subunit